MPSPNAAEERTAFQFLSVMRRRVFGSAIPSGRTWEAARSVTLGMFLVLAMIAPALASSSDLTRIREQFRAYSLSESMGRGDRILDDMELPKSLVAQAHRSIGSIRGDGSWEDIDYQSQTRSAWRAFDHLGRLLAITTLASQPDCSPADRVACLQAIHRGLSYWAAHDFRCPNWWYNEIGVPKTLGTIALLLDADLNDQERKYITGVAMARSKLGARTGQNREWLAGNALMRGLLTDDAALVAKAADVIWSELHISTDEGIQPDNSFHQHGPQLQFGNYGLAFASEMCRWAIVLRGTPMAVPENKLAVLRDFLLQGESWVVWRGVMDISSCGRQLFPHSPASKAAAIGAVMQSMPEADPSHAAEYRAFSSRNASANAANDLTGTRFFWRSDYGIDRGRSLCFSVRMHSPRTIAGEMVNSENLSGALLADGAAFSYQSATEYANIFPFWNWRQLPGTTEEQIDKPVTWPAHPPAGTSPPGLPFVGGASDGNFGCCAMAFSRDGLTARKAWFFSPDRMICLGCDIKCQDDPPVQTTIDQSLLQEPITLTAPQTNGVISGAKTIDMRRGDAIEHRGLRYTSLIDAPWKLAIEQRDGHWSIVFNNPATPKEPITAKLVTLSIEHGATPSDASYAYAISPAGADAVAGVAVTNRDTMQAVVDGDRAYLIFWQPGDFAVTGTAVSVDQPCVAILDPKARRITLADPTQTLKTVTVHIAGQPHTLALPTGAMAGSSVTVAF